MNKLLLTTLFLSVLYSSNCIGQDLKTASGYLTYIGEEYQKIETETWAYTKAASHRKNAKKIDKKRQELIQTTINARKRVLKMPPFEGKTNLKDSVAEALRLKYLILKEDYAKIVDLDEIAEQSYDKMEAYLLAKEEASKKSSTAFNMMYNEYKRFAKENGIKFTESEQSKISKKLEISGRVYDYYNKVYLVFFKSWKQDEYLMQAIQEKDLNAIEQNKNALRATTKEGLNKMTKIVGYNGDGSLKLSCTEILKFQNNYAKRSVDLYTNYLIKSQHFEEIKKSFDSKKQKDKTQSDVDQYNKAVAEANEALEQYREDSEKQHKIKTDLIQDWNKKTFKFINKHVP